MHCWSRFSLMVLRVSMVWVKSGVHFMVWSGFVCAGLTRQLSLPWGRTWWPREGLSRFLPHPWSSAGWLLLTVGSSTWHLPKLPEDVLEVEVKATALLRSRVVWQVWYYGSYKSLSVILWQLWKVRCDITTALKNQVWYLKSCRIAKIQFSESLNCRYDISHAIHAECDNTHVTKNRCDIIPAETHWVWYFKCLFS